MRRIALTLFTILTAIVVCVVMAKAENNQAHAPKSSFTSFAYNDSLKSISVTVYLPDAAGPWAVQEKYVGSDTSLLKEPQVFVESAFQNRQTKSFYGLIRISENLQGYDCGEIFSKLSEADGLQLKSYVDGKLEGVRNGKVYLFRYENKSNNIVATSKVLCDEKVGVEILLISPNDAKFSGPIDEILRMVQISIPGTSASQ